MKPVVHRLESTYNNRITFVYLDIDDPRNDDLKRMLNYRVQPHFILLDAEGNITQQWFGVVPESEFVSAFESVLE
jgi:thioredoxin-related protein